MIQTFGPDLEVALAVERTRGHHEGYMSRAEDAGDCAHHRPAHKVRTDNARLRAALRGLVDEIEHEAKYGAGLIYAWVHESNMEQARAALASVPSSEEEG